MDIQALLEGAARAALQVKVDKAVDQTCEIMVDQYLDKIRKEAGTHVSADQLSSVMSLGTSFVAAMILEHIEDHSCQRVPEMMDDILLRFREAVVEILDYCVEKGELEDNPLNPKEPSINKQAYDEIMQEIKEAESNGTPDQ